MPVAILTQFTPNPNAMKFILNLDVKSTGKITFEGPEQATGVPLVERLFELPYVRQVHLFENVITVSKDEDTDWQDAADQIKEIAGSEIQSHDPDFTPQQPERSRDDLPDDIRAIEDVLDRTVRPYLQGDGGDLDVLAYEDKRVVVSYQGACGSCPASESGTLSAIQGILRDEIDPEIEVVSAAL